MDKSIVYVYTDYQSNGTSQTTRGRSQYKIHDVLDDRLTFGTGGQPRIEKVLLQRVCYIRYDSC